MTTSPQWLRGAFHELTPEECRTLIAARPIGRLAFWGPDGPTVLPVNYVLADDGVRFRTSPYGAIARFAGGEVVGFEVDEFDEYTQSGWSVLARGVAEVVLGPVPDPQPDPWPEGVKSILVRIQPETLTGRRVMGH